MRVSSPVIKNRPASISLRDIAYVWINRRNEKPLAPLNVNNKGKCSDLEIPAHNNRINLRYDISDPSPEI